MQQSYLETDSRSASQEIVCILWNPKFIYVFTRDHVETLCHISYQTTQKPCVIFHNMVFLGENLGAPAGHPRRRAIS